MKFRTWLCLLLAGVLSLSAAAQERRMILSGEALSPAYEGWWPNEDGSFKLFFRVYEFQLAATV